MNEFDDEMRKLLVLETKPAKRIDSQTTLKDLYDSKRESLQLNDSQTCRILGIEPKTLKPIFNREAKQIDVVTLIKLSHFLGYSVDKLLEIYAPQMPLEMIGKIQQAKEATYLTEHFDLARLMKARFFEKTDTTTIMINKLKRFFGLESIYDYDKSSLSQAFSRTRRGSDWKVREFWVRSAIGMFENINNPYDYSREDLKELIPKIRPYSMNEDNGLRIVARALFHVGVTVIFQSSIEKLQVRGATISVNNKPCIVISDLNKKYPTLWFTLMHELYHVLFDYDDIKTKVYHVSSDEGDLLLASEIEADNFASEMLLDNSRLEFASKYIASKESISQIAQKYGVHPSIIYSFYAYKTGNWSLVASHIPTTDRALKLFNTDTFKRSTLLESVQEVVERIYS